MGLFVVSGSGGRPLGGMAWGRRYGEMSNGVLAFGEEVCVCGEHVKGRLAGAKTRGSKQMRMFECDGRYGCGHRWSHEVATVSVPTAPSNLQLSGNGNGLGHESVCCPNCKHKFEVTHG